MAQLFRDVTTTIKLSSPGEVIAAIPPLLGFRPECSLIFFGLRRNGLIQRSDLPPPEFEAEVVERMVGNLVASGETAVITVIISPPSRGSSVGKPPYRRLADMVIARLAEAGVALAHAVWAPIIDAEKPWLCYGDVECHGNIPDPASTELAATRVAGGAIAFAARSDIEKLLEPDRTVIDRRASLLHAARKDNSDGEQVRIARGLDHLRAAIRRIGEGRCELSDEQHVCLMLALAEKPVRDACLSTALPVDGAGSTAAHELWLTLVRAAAAPERAEPATLLAYSAYQQGNGVLAGIALENALEANPAHVLAALLSQALSHAVSPQRLAGLGALSTYSLWER